MRLRLEQTLPCEPAVAFSLTNDPRRMSLWVTARIESLALGDGGHPAGVGALRRIHLPGGRHIDEIVVASEPPRRFDYRALSDAVIRDHHGRLTFDSVGGGTRITWEIGATLRRRVLEPFAKRLLSRELGRSLDRLERIAASTAPYEAPPERRLGRPEELPELYEHAEATRDELRALARSLDNAGNSLQWHAQAQQQAVERQIDACRAGRLEHPGWILRLIPESQRYFLDGVHLWLRRELATVESHWREAFEAMERARRERERGTTLAERATAAGLRAHLEEDLPRALAKTWAAHYAGRCDYVRLRADHLTLSATVDAVGPYDVRRGRRLAFERGDRIAKLLTEQAPAARGEAR